MWLGWPILVVLAWSAVPAWFIGRAQRPRASALHDKVLSTDAGMREADWLTSVAAALGVGGIAAGWTWIDPVAGTAIGLGVVWSGYRQLRRAVTDLADNAPTTLDGDWDRLPDKVRSRLLEHDFIADAEVRFREQGRHIFGEAFVVPRSDEQLTLRLAAAAEDVRRMEWRICDFVVVPVPEGEAETCVPRGER